jgi:hypothetical protein
MKPKLTAAKDVSVPGGRPEENFPFFLQDEVAADGCENSDPYHEV